MGAAVAVAALLRCPFLRGGLLEWKKKVLFARLHPQATDTRKIQNYYSLRLGFGILPLQPVCFVRSGMHHTELLQYIKARPLCQIKKNNQQLVCNILNYYSLLCYYSTITQYYKDAYISSIRTHSSMRTNV
jgi:hypothetical protein